jgi:hypothetical protein
MMATDEYLELIGNALIDRMNSRDQMGYSPRAFAVRLDVPLETYRFRTGYQYGQMVGEACELVLTESSHARMLRDPLTECAGLVAGGRVTQRSPSDPLACYFERQQRDSSRRSGSTMNFLIAAQPE